MDDLVQRGGVEVVELVSAVPARLDQAGLLEHVEVLRDRLARHAQPFRGEPAAQLEERLTAAVAQLVEDGAPGRRGEGVEDVRDGDTIGK
ncbi:hypothetical protein OJ998_03805 [Solirubrobacter taibaiensis]|nr:hypothetical protein [Solirubrobacter taibaiensis]